MDGDFFKSIELDSGTLYIVKQEGSNNIYSWDFEWPDGYFNHGNRWVLSPERAIDDFEEWFDGASVR